MRFTLKLLSAACVLSVAAVLPRPALAQNDQDNTNHTGWTWLKAQSPSALEKFLSNNDARITDIQVASVNSKGVPSLDVVLVSNTGSYAKTWVWFYGMTGQQAFDYAANNGYRPVAIAPYVYNGSDLYAVAYIPNTGADASGWDMYDGSGSFVGDSINNDGCRPLQFKPIISSGATQGYIGVGITNDGRGWYYYYGVGASTINSTVSNGYRVTQLVPDTGGTFDAVLDSYSTAWWWMYNNTDDGTWGLGSWVTARPLCIGVNKSKFDSTWISN